jgi:hypothetical protein
MGPIFYSAVSLRDLSIQMVTIFTEGSCGACSICFLFSVGRSCLPTMEGWCLDEDRAKGIPLARF